MGLEVGTEWRPLRVYPEPYKEQLFSIRESRKNRQLTGLGKGQGNLSLVMTEQRGTIILRNQRAGH